MNYFAKNIKLLRKQRELTQAQMQDSIGFKQSTWNGYETGLSQPYMDGLIKISDFFDVSLSDLIENDLSSNPEKGKGENKKRSSAPYNSVKDIGNNLFSENNTNDISLQKSIASTDGIIETLSAAVRGLEASNAVLLQRITSLEEENNKLKKEVPAIHKGMEGTKAKSA